MLYISDTAQQYFIALLNKQKKGTQIRIFLKKSNTFQPEFGICYYFPEKNKKDDVIIKFDFFSVYIHQTITPFIKNTKIDLISNELGTHLSIHAPNINTVNKNKTNNMTHQASLEEKIKHILNMKINPQLAVHGGNVSLVQVTKDSIAVLKFHGGCNGCAMAYYTVKEGIEKTLKNLFPELKGVEDITQHKHGSHSYY